MDAVACLPFVRQSYADIRKARKWSFLKRNGVLYAPAAITSGTVAVTQFSSAVVADFTAAPLLNAAMTVSAPAQSLLFRQFRALGGPIYNITNWNNGTRTVTLDRPYAEPTVAAASYMVYQPYQIAPATDFDGWFSVYDPLNDYRFRKRNLYRSQAEIDRRDPYRQSFDWPLWLAFVDFIGTGATSPRYEMWPGPQSQNSYMVEYHVRGDAVLDGDTLPAQISDQLIMAGARMYGLQFLATQENINPVRLSAITSQQTQCAGMFGKLLQEAKRDDNEISETLVDETENEAVLSGPLDANYLLQHDVFWID
jgi:hypothetical protein